MSPHPENQHTPLGRVQAFVYHHRHTASTDLVQVVCRHDERGSIGLTRPDLEYVLDSLERIRNLAFRTADPTSPFLMDAIATIVHLASGTAPGQPAPAGPDQGMAITIKPDGGIYQDPTRGGDPYAAGGGGLRTRTCVHCGRRCGDVPGGSGVVNAAPVCYPPEGTTDRPNCYRRLLRGACTQVHVCREGCWRDGN